MGAIAIGVISFEAADGQITIDPAMLEIGIVFTIIAVFLVVLISVLYFAFNIYVMVLASKIRKHLKKAQNTADIPMQPITSGKQLGEYSSVPVNPTPVEFVQPVYLEKVVV